MDELIAEIHELIGAPPAGQEMLAAVAVSLCKSEIRADLDDVVTDLANSVIEALSRGRSAPGSPAGATRAGFNMRLAHSQQEAIDQAHEQLGISHHMVWALNARHLFVFKRSAIGDKPKRLTRRHAYRDIELVDVGHPAGGGDKTLQITLHRLPITVAIDEDEVVEFAKVLQQQLRSRPAPAAAPPAVPARSPVVGSPGPPLAEWTHPVRPEPRPDGGARREVAPPAAAPGPRMPPELVDPIDPAAYDDLA